jgi:transcriptional/translational regulatory protein YebC/TACO1
VIVEALTNNKNRTAGDIRSDFDKSGGALGVPGAVQFMFERKGIINVTSAAITKLADGDRANDARQSGVNLAEEKVLEILLDAPAEDISADEENVVKITTKPENFGAVIDYLENNAEWNALKGSDGNVTANIEWVPISSVAIPDNKQAAFERLIDNLENNEDVQAVYHNAV